LRLGVKISTPRRKVARWQKLLCRLNDRHDQFGDAVAQGEKADMMDVWAVVDNSCGYEYDEKWSPKPDT